MLEKLYKEHKQLDCQLDQADKKGDWLSVQRLKRQKLLLKDRISKISSMMTPDIIA